MALNGNYGNYLYLVVDKKDFEAFIQHFLSVGILPSSSIIRIPLFQSFSSLIEQVLEPVHSTQFVLRCGNIPLFIALTTYPSGK